MRAALERAFEQARVSSDDEAWGRYGVLLEAHGHDELARRAYRRAVELDPNDFRWSYFHAALLQFEEPAAAVPWFERALAIDPGYAPARVRFAQTLETLGREEEAAGEYRRATELEPDNAMAWLGRGRVALSVGDLDVAIPALERAHRLEPQVQATAVTLARAYLMAGRRADAEALATEARSLQRQARHRDPLRAAVRAAALDERSHLLRARTALDRGNPEAALAEVDAYLELTRDDVEGWLLKAEALDRLGRFVDAAASARRALELEPDSRPARVVLAGSLFKAGDVREAEVQAERVLERDPDHFFMLLVRAAAAGQRGAIEPLLASLDRAFEVRTGEAQLRSVLGQMMLEVAQSFEAVGRRAEAAELYRRLLLLAEEDGAPPETMARFRQALERLGGS